MYQIVIAGVGLVVVLLVAGRLRRSIQKDRARRQRLERYTRGPALAEGKTRYSIKR
jgi:hypothetical protein